MQLFHNIYKLFPYVLYDTKYMLVISHLGGYPVTLIFTYRLNSAYYALVFCNRPFLDLFIHQIL